MSLTLNGFDLLRLTRGHGIYDTSSVPQVLVAGVPARVVADKLGGDTVENLPIGCSTLWGDSDSAIKIGSLSVGDVFIVTLNASATSVTANTDIEIQFEWQEKDSSGTNTTLRSIKKTIASMPVAMRDYELYSSQVFVIGSENQRNGTLTMNIQSVGGAATFTLENVQVAKI